MSQIIVNETDRLRLDLARTRRVVAILGVALILSLLAIFKLANSTIVTFVPPTISQSFWVSHNKVSAEYLEEMGKYVLQLSENYTPKNIDYKNNSLLEKVDPEYYGVLKVMLAEKAERIKRNDIANVFHETGVQVDEQKQLVKIKGIAHTTVGNEALKPKNQTFLISFKYADGKISIRSIKEVQR